jgi:hypothetical protein
MRYRELRCAAVPALASRGQNWTTLGDGLEIIVERNDRLPKVPTEVIDNPTRGCGNPRNGEAWRYMKQQGLGAGPCKAVHWFGVAGDHVLSKSDAYPETAPAPGDLPIGSPCQSLTDFQQINYLRSARPDRIMRGAPSTLCQIFRPFLRATAKFPVHWLFTKTDDAL